MTRELSEIILERKFESVDSNGASGTIILRLGKPYQSSKSGSSLKWHCPFQIVGIDSEKVKEGPGMDAIDALLISLRIAEALIKSYGKTYNVKVTWLNEEDLGFYHPLQIEIKDIPDSMFEADKSPFKGAFEEFFRRIDADDAIS